MSELDTDGLAMTRCEEPSDDFDCTRRASRIGEWAANTVIRIPLCRRHAREKKRRAGWTVRRASRQELSELADRRAEGQETP
jgi:hypothetical protein